MPGSIVPDEEPGGFPLSLQLCATPVQKLRGNLADRTARHEATSLCGSAQPRCLVARELHNKPELSDQDQLSSRIARPDAPDHFRFAKRACGAEQNDSTTPRRGNQ